MARGFKNFNPLNIFHSAKGSTWENHKYIKRIDGTYYYPDNYEGGRHLSSLSSENGESESSNDDNKLSENDVEALAREVIRGNFGNGQIRKDLFGEYYQQVQDRVNEIMRSYGSTKVSDVSEEKAKEGTALIDKVISGSSSKGLDYETIYAVYRKNKK